MTENHLFLLNNKNRVEFKDALDIMQFVDVRDFKIFCYYQDFIR